MTAGRRRPVPAGSLECPSALGSNQAEDRCRRHQPDTPPPRSRPTSPPATRPDRPIQGKEDL